MTDRRADRAPASWRPEVFVEGKWASNQIRFQTREEADAYAGDWLRRWKLTERSRVAPSSDPPNYRLADRRLVPIDA